MASSENLNISDSLRDEYIQHSIQIQRYTEYSRVTVLNSLNELEIELVSLLSEADLDSLGFNSKRKVNALIKEISDAIAKQYTDTGNYFESGIESLAEIETVAALKIITGIVGVALLSRKLSKGYRRNLARDTLIDGATSKQWWRRQGQKLAQRFGDQVRQAAASGESTVSIVKRLRGTSTGKRVSYKLKNGKTRNKTIFKGGLMNVATRDAEALVVTAFQTASQAARGQLYKNNKDVIKGLQALSTLDTRTSEICRSRSGNAWTLEGKPLNGTTEPFPGYPPWHWRCRSMLIPILRSWEEVGLKVSPKKKKFLKRKISKTTQDRMKGQAAQDLTYETWLKKQPTSVQRDVLGVGKHKLWKAGKLTLRDMVDQRGNPLTLKEIRKNLAG